MAAQLTWRPQFGSFSFHAQDVKAWDALPWPRVTSFWSYFRLLSYMQESYWGEDWKYSMETNLPISIGRHGPQYR